MDPATQAALLDLLTKAAVMLAPLALTYAAGHFKLLQPLLLMLAAAFAGKKPDATPADPKAAAHPILAAIEARVVAAVEAALAQPAAATPPAAPKP